MKGFKPQTAEAYVNSAEPSSCLMLQIRHRNSQGLKIGRRNQQANHDELFFAASAEAPYYLLLIPTPSCFSWSGRDNSLKQRGVWNTQEGGVNLLWVHDFHICCILNLVVCSKVDSCAQKAIRTDWPHQRQFLSFIMWTHGSHIRMPWSIGVKRHLFLSCGLFLSTLNAVDRIANIGPI